MTVAALVTQGIGPGSSITYLLTGGLDIGTPPPVAPGDGDYFRPRPAKPKPPQWVRQRDEDARLVKEVRQIYERVVEGKTPPAAVTKEIAQTVAPYVEPSRRTTIQPLPPSASIDWTALARTTEALNQLLAGLERTRQHAAAKRLADEIALEEDDMNVIETFLRTME